MSFLLWSAHWNELRADLYPALSRYRAAASVQRLVFFIPEDLVSR